LGLIVYVVVVLPPVVVRIRRLAGRPSTPTGRYLAAGVGLLGAGLAALVAACLMPRMRSAPAGIPGPYLHSPLALFAGVTDWTPYFGWWPNLGLGALIVAGIIFAYSSRRKAWLAASFALAFAWYSVAALITRHHVPGEACPRWFLDPLHLAPLLAITGIPLAALALSTVLGILRRWWEAGRPVRSQESLVVAACGVGVLLTMAQWAGLMTGYLSDGGG
jgi:hypothetical protein